MKSTFKLVKLVLAREPGHPSGDSEQGYRLVLPLTADGLIDEDAYRTDPDRCHVVREDPEGDRVGRLNHGPGGQWRFHYPEAKDEPDVGFRFGSERFVPGEYVSLRRSDGDHTYRVVSQQPV